MDETLILNLIGTFAFGLTGGILAVRKKMDLFGILVLSVATGLGGGIMRDIILGHVPPTTLVDWRYLAAAGLAGLLVFFDFRQIVKWNRFVTAFDAAGLAIFTVTGTTIALAAQLNSVPAALLGMLTGIWRWSAEGRTGCGGASGAEERSIRGRFPAWSDHNHSG